MKRRPSYSMAGLRNRNTLVCITSCFFSRKMAEDMRPTLEATTDALHSLLGHISGYEIEDNKVSLLRCTAYPQSHKSALTLTCSIVDMMYTLTQSLQAVRYSARLNTRLDEMSEYEIEDNKVSQSFRYQPD